MSRKKILSKARGPESPLEDRGDLGLDEGWSLTLEALNDILGSLTPAARGQWAIKVASYGASLRWQLPLAAKRPSP